MRINSLGRKNYKAGQYDFGPHAIGTGFTRVTIILARNNWPLTPADTLIEAAIDLSLDGGSSWIPNHVAASFVGGTYITKAGTTLTESTMGIPLPEPGNPNRVLRGKIVVAEGLNTSVDVETV